MPLEDGPNMFSLESVEGVSPVMSSENVSVVLCMEVK